MTVKYEMNRWGEKVAMADDGPMPIVVPNPKYNWDQDVEWSTDPTAPTPKWMQDIFDTMTSFDPLEKQES